MLAHSPPLLLVIDYFFQSDITAEDEEGAILALNQRDRLRCVRLGMPVASLQKLIMALDEEYPILEYLIIMPLIEDNTTTLIFPEALQAPHLRYLVLFGFSLRLGSRLLTTALGLVTLWLHMVHPSTYFHPNTLLQWISLMPQLETLVIAFRFPPSRDVERQLTHTPVTATVVLPNLHWFWFRGVTTYLEALVCRITTPHLEKLEIVFYNRLMFSIPHLLQFMSTAENLRFDRAQFEFDTERVVVRVYPRGAKMHALVIIVRCWHLDWQVSSVSQIFNSLRQMFSTVEHLILRHEEHSWLSEEHNEVDRTEWRKLLKSFSNVKTLRIDGGLVEEVSRCLKLEDASGERPLGLLPELQELTYTGSGDTGDAFTSFADARQNAGRPITLDRNSPSPDPSVSSFETSSTTPASSEAGSDLDT
jgi:hypothetical protein